MQCPNTTSLRLCLCCLVYKSKEKFQSKTASLKLSKRTHIGAKEFNNLNWLPVEQRFHQCLCVNTFKYFNDICPLYLKDIF